MKILQFPLSRITVAFVLGIVFFAFLKTTPVHAFIYNAIGFSTLLLLYFFVKNNTNFKYIFGLVVLINAFFIGITTASIHKQTFYANHYSHYLNDLNNNFEGTILIIEKLKK